MPKDSHLDWADRNPSNQNDRARAAERHTPARSQQELNQRDQVEERGSTDQPPPRRRDRHSPWLGGG